MNTDAVEGYVVPVTYKIHRQEKGMNTDAVEGYAVPVTYKITSSKNQGMNTDAVEGYVVPVTYKIHRQKTRESTQMLLKGMQFLLLTRYIVKKPGNEHRCC